MTELTIEQKAAYFDFLATHVTEMKLQFPNGGNDWSYNDKRTVKSFSQIVTNLIESGEDDDEEED